MRALINKLKIILTMFFLILGFQNCSLNDGFKSQTESSISPITNDSSDHQNESNLEDNTPPITNPSSGDNQSSVSPIEIAWVRSSSHDGNVPENAIDQNLNTRWSAEGKGEFLDIQFSGQYKLSDIVIYFYKGSERTSHFDILGWSDLGWVHLFVDADSATSGVFQASPSPHTPLSGIRIVGDGNNINQWNSITEVQLSGSLQSTSVVTLPALETPPPESPPDIDTDDVNAGHVLSRVYLSTEELSKIKELAAQGMEPVATAYNKAIANAEQAMSTKLQSVTYQGQSSHDYYTQKPYNWSNNMPSPCGSTHCDGYINPKADRGDYSASILMARAVRSLGIAYALTGETKYAKRAIEHINSWAINSSTYMSPKVFGSQGIEQYATFPAMFYGASLIQSYSGWADSEKTQFLQWTKDFIYHAETYSYSNNWENWRQAFIITGAASINDKNLINQQILRFKSTLTNFIDSTGRMKKELSRTRSLDYSMYALAAMTVIAEVAHQRGVNLYNYQAGSVGLTLAWQYHTPYLLNTSSWPYEQIKSYNKEGLGIYEIAYARTKDPQYLKVINKYGRPLYEDRCFGPITLTHGVP